MTGTTRTAAERAGPRTAIGQQRLLWIAGWLAATSIVVLGARSVHWRSALAVLADAGPSWLVAAVVANALILAAWTVYWRCLLPAEERPVSHAAMFEIAASASAVMNTVPFGAGHAAALVLLVRRGGTSAHGAASVLALDQLGEGVVKVSLFALVGVLLPLPAWMHAGVVTAAVVVAAFGAVLLIVAFRFPHTSPAPSDAAFARTRRFVARWAAGLDALRSRRRSVGALASVSAMKLFELVAIVAAQRALGVHVSAAQTLLVLAAVLLATMVSVSPANLGTYEAAVYLAYRYAGVPADQSVALAIVQHVCFIVPAVGIGYALLTRRAMWRSVSASS